MRRLSLLPVIVALVALAAACGERGGEETTTHSVRGQVARVADGGRSLVVDHEDIPGLMPAMQMTFPVQDAAVAKDLAPGDKIRFELFVGADGQALVGAVERLPADTPLALAAQK